MRYLTGQTYRKRAGLIPLVLLLSSCNLSRQPAPEEADASQAASRLAAPAECQAAAKKALGTEAVVLRCGDLNGTGALEVIAALEHPERGDTKENSFRVRRVKILRFRKSGWETALDMSNTITNPKGYVLIRSIDDTQTFVGLYMRLTEESMGGRRGLTLEFTGLLPNGEQDLDACPSEIAWNPDLGRYQELEKDNAFRPERQRIPRRVRDERTGQVKWIEEVFRGPSADR
jgi:hypothetical protein